MALKRHNNGKLVSRKREWVKIEEIPPNELDGYQNTGEEYGQTTSSQS